MLPTEEQIDVAGEATPAEVQLFTGDLGSVVLRALLENGTGYVVSSWRDRPTPIDAAIDEARDRVLSPHGVVLRRLRSIAALEPIVTAPTGGVTGEPPRGAVVFAGRRGLRPVLEQFLAVRASGAVVGFCFDEDAQRIEDAVVLVPEPTAIGLVRTIDAAYRASLLSGRPALVVLTERMLGMRGTVRGRATVAPARAAAEDAAHRAASPFLDVPTALARCGRIRAELGVRAEREVVLVASGPIASTVDRALAQLAALHPEDAERIEATAVVQLDACGVLPAPDGEVGVLLQGAARVVAVGARASRIAERISTEHGRSDIVTCDLDPGRVRGEDVVSALARLLLDPSADDAQGVHVTATRVPRRSEVLHRGVTPTVAAGLVLAQGVIGVPSRVAATHPTYRTDTGVPLTVVDAETFALHGVASAAPGSTAGVFVVTGPASGVAEAAGAAGGSIEYVDGSAPRGIGAAIGRACRAPRAAPHVIVVTEVQRVAAPRASTFGMDPDLVGTERLATAAVPPAATALVDFGDDLLDGPTVLVLDHPEAHAALDPLRELSPATWDLRRSAAAPTRASRATWNLRRRLVRSITGVDL